METEKILLRPWLDSDAETLFKYASDPDVGSRKGGNTELLVEAFAKGAAAQLQVETEYYLCLRFFAKQSGKAERFNIEDAGKVFVRGVKEKGDIKNTDALNEAYALGRSI